MGMGCSFFVGSGSSFWGEGGCDGVAAHSTGGRGGMAAGKPPPAGEGGSGEGGVGDEVVDDLGVVGHFEGVDFLGDVVGGVGGEDGGGELGDVLALVEFGVDVVDGDA